jgi:hypothetical protein
LHANSKVKNSKTIGSEHEPDFLAFYPLTRNCYIVEVKDGDQFDTKKAAGERQMLENFGSIEFGVGQAA